MLWPELLIAVVVAESLLLLNKRFGFRVALLLALLVSVLLAAGSYYAAPEVSYNREHRPLLYFAVGFLALLASAVVLLVAAWVAGKQRPFLSQTLAVVAAVCVTLAFPRWVLMVACGTGLDCV
jgi:hypothetical protein